MHINIVKQYFASFVTFPVLLYSCTFCIALFRVENKREIEKERKLTLQIFQIAKTLLISSGCRS